MTPRPPPAGPQGRGTRSAGSTPPQPRGSREPEARAAPTASPAPRRQHFPELSEAGGWGTRGGPCPGQQSGERRPREPLS